MQVKMLRMNEKEKKESRKFQTIQNLFILAFEFHHTSAEEILSDGQFCEFGYYRNQDFPTVIEGQLWGSEGHVGSVLFFSAKIRDIQCTPVVRRLFCLTCD